MFCTEPMSNTAATIAIALVRNIRSVAETPAFPLIQDHPCHGPLLGPVGLRRSPAVSWDSGKAIAEARMRPAVTAAGRSLVQSMMARGTIGYLPGQKRSWAPQPVPNRNRPAAS